MTRILLSFLAGSLVSTTAVILADHRSMLMFSAGILTVSVAIVAGLCSLKRARSVAHFALSVCDWLEGYRKGHKSYGKPFYSSEVPVKPSTAPEFASQLQEVTSALINLGVTRKKAVSIASRAVADGGTREDMMRRAFSQACAN